MNNIENQNLDSFSNLSYFDFIKILGARLYKYLSLSSLMLVLILPLLINISNYKVQILSKSPSEQLLRGGKYKEVKNSNSLASDFLLPNKRNSKYTCRKLTVYKFGK